MNESDPVPSFIPRSSGLYPCYMMMMSLVHAAKRVSKQYILHYPDLFLGTDTYFICYTFMFASVNISCGFALIVVLAFKNIDELLRMVNWQDNFHVHLPF